MNVVLNQLKDQHNIYEITFNYIKKRVFYPYIIIRRIDYRNFSFYHMKKIHKFVNFKIFSKCLEELILYNL